MSNEGPRFSEDTEKEIAGIVVVVVVAAFGWGAWRTYVKPWWETTARPWLTAHEHQVSLGRAGLMPALVTVVCVVLACLLLGRILRSKTAR